MDGYIISLVGSGATGNNISYLKSYQGLGFAYYGFNVIIVRIAVKSMPNPYQMHIKSMQIHTQYIKSIQVHISNPCQINATSMRNLRKPMQNRANPFQSMQNLCKWI